MKYLEGRSTRAVEQGGLKAEAAEANSVTRQRRDDRRAISDGDEGEQQAASIWTTNLRWRSRLDPISDGIALTLRDWGVTALLSISDLDVICN